jgi:hypothetical protein
MSTFHCAKCGTTKRVQDPMAGEGVMCGTCGAVLGAPEGQLRGSVDGQGSASVAGRASTSQPPRDTVRTVLKRAPGWLVLPPLALLAGGGLALAWLSRPDGADVDARTVVVPKPDSAFAAPMFGPVDLSRATSVVFLLDQGGASASAWPELVRMTLASVWNLGPGREVRVGVWQAEYGAPITPSGIASVSQRRELARELLAGVRVGGTPELLPALAAVIEHGPSDIVLVSGSASHVEPGAVLARLGGAGVRIHVLSLGSAVPGAGWRVLAQQTGGFEGTLDPSSPGRVDGR